MATLPQGTVTLLFTDIKGSTRLLHHLGPAYEDVLRDHRALLREAFSSKQGIEVDTQGDAFFYAFAGATEAARAAAEAQEALSAHPWPESADVRVRMGLHSGQPTVTGEGYVGPDVHLAARICAAAHGAPGAPLRRDRTPRPQRPRRHLPALPGSTASKTSTIPWSSTNS